MFLVTYLRKSVVMVGLICLAALLLATGAMFLYLSDAFKPAPKVEIRAENLFSETLRVVTDSDYEPFSYLKDGAYMGMDVELIAEIANRLHMNLELKLADWTTVNKIFQNGGADAILNMETDYVIADNSGIIATIPTVEKQYVVYGRQVISSVAELYGKKVVSLHKLPELGLGDGIKYLDSYAEVFNELKEGACDFAICPVQVGDMFLEKLNLTDVRPSYAVGHVFGAIALSEKNQALKEKMDAVISQLQKEGFLSQLEKKWITHRYQSMTLRGMIESHPEILAALVVGLIILALLLVTLQQQNHHVKEVDGYLKNLSEKNDELVVAKQRADASNRAKSDFLANMSHEIRTPINAVLGMNEMIIRESNDDNITMYARNVESAGKSLLSIINDILDFSKIEAGKMEIVKADYRLSSVLNDVANMIIFKARQKNLKFEVDVDKTLPDGLFGDEVRVRQVLTNVLNNAVKYTKEGSVKFFVTGSRDDDVINMNFKIIDTGIGIKPEDLPKLFNKFQRVDMAQNSTVEGTGLGLSITQNLLRLMDGTIEVASEYGKGSTFTVNLPQKVINDEAIGDFKEKFKDYVHGLGTYHETFKAPDAKILVVDDTPMNLTVVEGFLSKTDIQLDTASSGFEALELCKEKKYDLIFMDHRMPQMNGTEAKNKIREQDDGLNRDTVVICLTADAVSGAKARYISEGFTDYLSKPINSSALEAALKKYLPPEKIIVQQVQAEETQKAESSKTNKTELEEFYSGVASLKYEDALRFCMNEELLKKTLEQFYKSIESNANTIEEFFNDRDYENYTIKIHALKSSARLIGALSLSERAAYLEECGNDLSEKSLEEIRRLTPELLTDYRGYIEKLSPLYAAQEAERETAPEITPEMLKEVYEAIEEFATLFDIDSIDEVIKMARKYKIPQEQAQKFKAIEEYAHKMDWAALNEAVRS